MTLLGNLQTDKSLGRFLKLSYHYAHLLLPLPVILLFGRGLIHRIRLIRLPG